MFRLVLGVVCLWPGFLAAAGFDLCQDDKADNEARIAACTSVVEDPEFRLEALYHRGRLFRITDQWSLAKADLDVVIDAQPENQFARRNRVLVLRELEQYPAMLADAETLVQQFPDAAWNHRYLGRALTLNKREVEALPAYDRALELSPDYEEVFWYRGHVRSRNGNPGGAYEDFTKYIAENPFWAPAYVNQGRALDDLGRTEAASKAFRIALTLDPNKSTPRLRLEEHVGPEGEISLPPLDYVPPSVGLGLKFLQVMVKKETVSPEDEIVGDLIAWFKPTLRAVPSATAFVTRRILAASEAHVAVRIELAELGKRGRMIPERLKFPMDIDEVQGMTRDHWQAGKGPAFAVVFEGASPRDLWPLTEGRKITGTGGIDLVCPEGFSLPAAAVGCIPEQRRVRVGEIRFEARVEPSMRIHVPLGQFDVFVIRYAEKGTITMLGRTEEREVVRTWYWAPSLGYWVKRVDQIDDQLVVHQAVERLD